MHIGFAKKHIYMFSLRKKLSSNTIIASINYILFGL